MMSLLPALAISKIAAQGVDFDNYIEINEIGHKAPPTLYFEINVCKIPNVHNVFISATTRQICFLSGTTHQMFLLGHSTRKCTEKEQVSIGGL